MMRFLVSLFSIGIATFSFCDELSLSEPSQSYSNVCVVAGECGYVSGVVIAGDYAYVSGQFPIDPVTGRMAEGNIGTLTHLTLDHLNRLLLEAGFVMQQVISTRVYLTDIRDYDGMDSAYASRFNFIRPPVRDVVAAANLPNNARIEISCVAYKKH
jgi:2-iminobutanoate/2-iminopropanoate deaminase